MHLIVQMVIVKINKRDRESLWFWGEIRAGLGFSTGTAGLGIAVIRELFMVTPRNDHRTAAPGGVSSYCALRITCRRRCSYFRPNDGKAISSCSD